MPNAILMAGHIGNAEGLADGKSKPGKTRVIFPSFSFFGRPGLIPAGVSNKVDVPCPAARPLLCSHPRRVARSAQTKSGVMFSCRSVYNPGLPLTAEAGRMQRTAEGI
jgi:hypothetical protein